MERDKENILREVKLDYYLASDYLAVEKHKGAIEVFLHRDNQFLTIVKQGLNACTFRA